MSQQNLVQSIIYTLGAFLCLALALFVPNMSFLIFLVPVLFLSLGLKVNPTASYIATGFFFLVTTITFPGSFTIFLGLVFALTPAALTLYIKTSEHLEDTIMRGTVVGFLALIMSSFALKEFSGINIVEVLGDLFEKRILSDEQFRMLLWNLELTPAQLITTIKQLFPVLCFSVSLAWIILLYGISLLLKKMKKVDFFAQPLDTFRYRKLTIGQLLGFLIALFIASSMSGDEVFITNVTAILFIVFSLEGASVVYYYLRQKKVPQIICLFIILLTFFLPYLQRVYGFIGLLDNPLDFRKLENTK